MADDSAPRPKSRVPSSKREIRYLRDLTRYLKILRVEAEEFLSRACCHEDAIGVWASYFQLRDIAMPAVFAKKELPPIDIKIDELIDFIQTIVRLRTKITDEMTAIDGTVLDMLKAKHDGNHQAMMHDFCRMPLLGPGKKARRQTLIIDHVGPLRVPMPGPKEPS